MSHSQRPYRRCPGDWLSHPSRRCRWRLTAQRTKGDHVTEPSLGCLQKMSLAWLKTHMWTCHCSSCITGNKPMNICYFFTPFFGLYCVPCSFSISRAQISSTFGTEMWYVNYTLWTKVYLVIAGIRGTEIPPLISTAFGTEIWLVSDIIRTKWYLCKNRYGWYSGHNIMQFQKFHF